MGVRVEKRSGAGPCQYAGSVRRRGISLSCSTCHVAAGLSKHRLTRGIGLAAQGHAGRGQLVELELRVRMAIRWRALQREQRFVLGAPHGFAATRSLRRTQHELGAEEAEDAQRGVVMREDQ